MKSKGIVCTKVGAVSQNADIAVYLQFAVFTSVNFCGYVTWRKMAAYPPVTVGVFFIILKGLSIYLDLNCNVGVQRRLQAASGTRTSVIGTLDECPGEQHHRIPSVRWELRVDKEWMTQRHCIKEIESDEPIAV